MTDEDFVAAAAGVLGAASLAVPGPAGLAVGVLAEVLPEVYRAIKDGGQNTNAVVAAIKKSIVAAADAQMKAELGP